MANADRSTGGVHAQEDLRMRARRFRVGIFLKGAVLIEAIGSNVKNMDNNFRKERTCATVFN